MAEQWDDGDWDAWRWDAWDQWQWTQPQQHFRTPPTPQPDWWPPEPPPPVRVTTSARAKVGPSMAPELMHQQRPVTPPKSPGPAPQEAGPPQEEPTLEEFLRQAPPPAEEPLSEELRQDPQERTEPEPPHGAGPGWEEEAGPGPEQLFSDFGCQPKMPPPTAPPVMLPVPPEPSQPPCGWQGASSSPPPPPAPPQMPPVPPDPSRPPSNWQGSSPPPWTPFSGLIPPFAFHASVRRTCLRHLRSPPLAVRPRILRLWPRSPSHRQYRQCRCQSTPWGQCQALFHPCQRRRFRRHLRGRLSGPSRLSSRMGLYRRCRLGRGTSGRRTLRGRRMPSVSDDSKRLTKQMLRLRLVSKSLV